MVEAGNLAIAFAVVTAMWFVGTGLVAMLNHRLRASFARALAIAGGCAATGLALVVFTGHLTSVWATYASFFGGLLIWAWHEISFLTGAVAGSHRDPCPADARGWRRFSLATMALIHHEIALAMTAALLLALAALTANPAGAYAFGLLAIFRLSSKLNIYSGVPSMSDELLPRHLDYLKTYFGPPRLALLLPLSVAAILSLAGWFGHAAMTAAAPHDTVRNALLAGLALLAALEHLFLAMPFRDSLLWQWAIGTGADRTRT